MTRILCVANQKGGVGKTTTAISLADALAKAAEKTLLVDLDPQCNATSGLGFKPLHSHPLVSGEPFADCVVQTATEGLELLCGSGNFADVEALTRGKVDETQRMHAQMSEEFERYDYVLIDCPPSVGHLTQIAMLASTEVLIPVSCDFFAIEGMAALFQTAKKAMAQRPGFSIGGIVLTLYDASLQVTQEAEQDIREFAGDIVFNTVIPRDVRIVEAASRGQSIIDYAPRSHGARAYIELCMEVLERD